MIRRPASTTILTLLMTASCSTPTPPEEPLSRLQTLEQKTGGRLGVAMVTAQGHLLLAHRDRERFAMCSTFKAALAAVCLEQAAAGRLSLEEEIPVSSADLVPYAPVVQRHLDQGRLRVDQLCRAAVQLSDNAAANLLLRRIGGPAAFTAFCRRHGDTMTRLDRYECELNENALGDPRDTTTPQSMARLLANLLYSGRQLQMAAQLHAWMAGSRTGKNRIRAGLPSDWPVGNKTGTAPRQAPAFCDLAFFEPPGRSPVVLAVYCDRPTADSKTVEAAIAEVARICAGVLQP